MKCHKCGKENKTLVRVVTQKDEDTKEARYEYLYCVNCLFTPAYKGVKPTVVTDEPWPNVNVFDE